MKLQFLKEAYQDVVGKMNKNSDIGDDAQVPELDEHAKKSIGRYTYASSDTNLSMRDVAAGHKFSSGLSHQKIEDINNLQNAAHSISHKKPPHLFSGISVDIFRIKQVHGVSLDAPLRLHSPSFTSTSVDFDIAGGFCKSFMLRKCQMAMDMIKKLNHDASVYSYKHLLCFEGVEKFLKVCDEVGGNFGDEEREFILPHSIDIEISAIPTIEYSGPTTVLFIWDAKVLHYHDKVFEHHEKYDPSQVDTGAIDLAHDIQSCIEKNELGGNVDVAVVRLISTLKTGRIHQPSYSTYIKEGVVALLMMLDDVDLIGKEAKLIKNILNYLNLSKKSFLDLDPERYGYHVDRLFKIIDGVSHG